MPTSWKNKDLRRVPGFTKADHTRLGATLPWLVWKALLLRMIELITQEILGNRAGFSLPSNLGLLQVVKMKRRKDKPFIDLRHLCQTGLYRTQHNFHSFGAIYRLDWTMLPTTHFANRMLYRFKACRGLNRELAQRIFAGQDYLAQDPHHLSYLAQS